MTVNTICGKLSDKDVVLFRIITISASSLMNKVFRFSIIFALAALTSCLSSQLLVLSSNAQVVSQASNSMKQPPVASNELLNGVIVAVVSGIIGFLASFVIERIKKKNEPRKQISYSKVVKSGIVGKIEKDIEGKIGVLYNGKPAQNMFYALFDIENTGNQQVKNQEIRFEFTDDSEILDVFHSPQKIEPEMELKELLDSNLGNHQKKFRIGVIKPKQKLGFRFIVQGPKNESLDFKYHPKNDDDVSFIKIEDKKVADDVEQVRSFLINCLIAFVVFPLMKENAQFFLFPELSFSLLSLGSLIVFGLLIIPNLENFIKSVVNLASKKQSDIQSEKIGMLVMGGSVNVENLSISPDKNEV